MLRIMWGKTGRHKQQVVVVVFALVMGCLGVYALRQSSAATTAVATEAESGLVAGPASRLTSEGASGGSSVRFQAASSGSGSATFKLFAPAWRGLGEEGANAARSFTEIYGSQNPASIHAANPAAFSYKYTLGPYVTAPFVPCDLIPADNEYKTKRDSQGNLICGKTALARSAIAKGTDGMALYAVGFTNNFLIVPDDPAWISYIRTKTASDILFAANNYYDGILTDSMGGAPVTSNYLNAKPVNAKTGQLYTEAEWNQAQLSTVAAKRDGLPTGKKLMLNGLANGTNYWDVLANSPRTLLTDAVDGGMAERIFREPHGAIDQWPAASAWLKDVQMIEDVEDTYHKKGYWWSKCWAGNGTCKDEANSVALIKQWLRYVSCSYLLGAGSNSFFNFDTDINDGNAAEYFSEYDTLRALGAARGAKAQVGGTGAYTRQFEQGFISVNPTNSPITIDLGNSSYSDFDGTARTGSYSLPAHTGQLFKAN